MQIHFVPSYCGGLILTGFYSPRTHLRAFNTLENRWDKNYLPSLRAKGGPESAMRHGISTEAILPNCYEDFCSELKSLLTPYSSFPNAPYSANRALGAIFAVTNTSQPEGTKYLKEIGFESTGVFATYHGRDLHCTTWIGDWHKVIGPNLAGHKSVYNILIGNGVKKGKFS